jgi:D-alanyl-D-alanine carboxypeptidase (penicillin-binding protein 5/6)
MNKFHLNARLAQTRFAVWLLAVLVMAAVPAPAFAQSRAASLNAEEADEPMPDLGRVEQAPLGVAYETPTRYAILIDASTGTVLYEKNADTRMPTASMSKVMTMYMVFEALKQGRLTLQSTLPVSEKAWRIQGSKMFVPLGGMIAVEDLIRGVIVQSGNDATIVLAEGLAGSEEAFAEQMTERARQLGMSGSNFMNASGWPDPEHYSTARDLALLATRLIEDFPEYYHYYAEKSFTFGVDQASGRPITQGNRNPLLYAAVGGDGLKTGHTEEAGYGLLGSAKRGDRRLIMVVAGLESMKQRAEESVRFIEWGFRNFNSFRLFKAGETIDEIPVWLGDRRTVPLVVAKDLNLTLSQAERRALAMTLLVDAPVAAPFDAGHRVGRVVVTLPGRAPIEVPVVTAEGAGALGFTGRISAAMQYLLLGN